MSIIERISQFGNKYRGEFLSVDGESIRNYWWNAFDFFLSKAFYQGRLDTVSKQIYDIAKKILEEYFPKDNNQRLIFQNNNNWNELKLLLDDKIGRGRIGKSRDVEMVISALKFVENIEGNNLVNYSINEISNNRLSQHYYDIQKSENENGIVQVGKKIAAFYLRDIVSVFNLENNIQNEDFIYLQPIDTWLRKIAKKINIVPQDANDRNIINMIVEQCNNENVSPILFNQGAWYLGYNAFNILLDKIIIEDVG